MTEKDLEIQTLLRQMEKLKEENRALRAEICLHCGLNRSLLFYKGACDNCRYADLRRAEDEKD